MPDRYGEEPQAYDNPHDIADCDLCDDDGMRGMLRCDHIDHGAASKRGMDMIRAAMGWGQLANQPYCNRCGIPHAGNCKRKEDS